MVRHGLLGRVQAGLDAQALHCVGDRVVAGLDRLRRVKVTAVRVIGVEDGIALALAPIEGRDLAVANAKQGARDVGFFFFVDLLVCPQPRCDQSQKTRLKSATYARSYVTHTV